jgi:hypothetical protein
MNFAKRTGPVKVFAESGLLAIRGGFQQAHFLGPIGAVGLSGLQVAAWIGTGSAVLSGGRALPARSMFTDRPQFGASPSDRGTSPAPMAPATF